MYKKKTRATARLHLYPEDHIELKVRAAKQGQGVKPADVLHELLDRSKNQPTK